MNTKLALRIDDIGASSKRYEVYSDYVFKWRKVSISANWLFLKYLPLFKKWGPYQEMTVAKWENVLELLESYKAKLTVGVTATWVDGHNTLIPFPEKFPGEAKILKEGLQQGLLEIANHGLTHCVVKDNLFKPRWFSSNRRFHREFWDWVPFEQHEEHIYRSQEILQTYFKTDVVTFVPPGNVFTQMTLKIARRYGLHYVSCNTPKRLIGAMSVVGNEQVLPFHDRDVILYGIDWLRWLIEKNQDRRFCFVKELGKMMFVEAKEIELG